MDITDQAIRAAASVGRQADFWRYNRTGRNPMNMVLDEAEKQLPKSYVVYWVAGGAPENFILQDFDPAPVAYSSRYLEIVGFIGDLLAQKLLKSVRREVSERTCLRLMAELSLCHGDPDLAVLAFIKSIIGQRMFIPTARNMGGLEALEMQPISEAYMVTWFFGLVHELGHIIPTNDEFAAGSFVKHIESEIEGILTQLPEVSLYRSKKIAQLEGGSHPLETEHLRDEVIADFFAMAVLHKATVNLLHDIGKTFSIYEFMKEMMIFLRIVSIIDHCKQTAKAASINQSEYDFDTSWMVARSSYFVRSLLLRKHLTISMASFLSGDLDPNSEAIVSIDKLFEAIHSELVVADDEVEEGMLRAVQFMLNSAEHNTNLIVKFEEEVSQITGLFALIEAREFYKLADSLEVTSDLLERLRKVVDNLHM